MGIGKRILSVLIGILFIISVSVLEEVCLAKKVLVKAISQAGIDTAISHTNDGCGIRLCRSR